MSFKNIYSLKRKNRGFYRVWSENEKNILRTMTEQKKSVSEISVSLGRTYNSVVHMRRKLLIVSTVHFSSYEDSIVRRYAGVLSSSEIGAIIGRPHYAVLNYASRHGIPLIRYGDNHQGTVYSDEDVNLVRALYDEGVSFSDILDKFDIPFSRLCTFLYTDVRHISSDYYLLCS
ncbi:hypothetical protein [Escherichia coli]|uniref:hypothetical protein n=1 Tax=Escherichia coli TaxID=562 RepID=UPI001E3C7CAA|nr:hypothetical protein [Escherichia coli]